MRVLVTGAAGFIGSHVVRSALAAHHDVVAVVRPGARRDRLPAGCTPVEADAGDRAALRGLLEQHHPDVVIHLAWYAEPGRYRHAIAENVGSLAATAGLLLAAAEAGCPRVVLGGSCVEGEARDREERPIYDAAKRAAHELGAGFAGAPAVACGHVFYLYGPFEDDRRVVPSVIRSVLAGDPVPTTTGEQRRDYLHVADVADGFVAVAASALVGGVDICSGSLVSLADVFRIIGEVTSRPDLIRLGELGPSEDAGYQVAGDPTRLRAVGWRPRLDLRTGIESTIDWWRARLEARA